MTGAYLAIDTDSMMIVASPEGGGVPCLTSDGRTVPALSFQRVRDLLSRFDQLNPFDPELVRSVWKIEHRSDEEPLFGYAISAKRYCLFRYDSDGEPELGDWSEHGLGLYLDPTDPEHPRRDEEGRRIWIKEAWDLVLREALGLQKALPIWANRFALTRFTISSPHLASWFAGFDEGKPFEEKMRPGSFGLLAHGNYGNLPPTGLRIALPAAPYESNPDRWEDLRWLDAGTGARVELIGTDPEIEPGRFAEAVQSGLVPVKRLRDVLRKFRERPEHKSLAPDGSPAGPESRGLLLRRPVESSPILTNLRGKEGHALAERELGLVVDPEGVAVGYGVREGDPFRDLVVPVLREIGPVEVARRTGISRWTVQRVIREQAPSEPRSETRRDLIRFVRRLHKDRYSDGSEAG